MTRDPQVGVGYVLASAIAVSIIKDRRADRHSTPSDDAGQILLCTNHTTRVLAELGMTREQTGDLATTAIHNQVMRRGGYGADAQPILFSFIGNCMQCMTQDIEYTAPQIFDSASARRAWSRTHTTDTGHTVIQRWEQPSAL